MEGSYKTPVFTHGTQNTQEHTLGELQNRKEWQEKILQTTPPAVDPEHLNYIVPEEGELVIHRSPGLLGLDLP